jgi:rhomboid family GlyGly-CTERM serine protease
VTGPAEKGAFRLSSETVVRWLPVLFLVSASIALGLGEDEFRTLGRYDRDGLLGGELWRLVTAHLVHLSWGHVWLNLVALVLMAILFDGFMSARDWIVATVLSALAIDAGLFFFEPEVGWYVGLSGSLHGMMVVGAVAMLRAGFKLAAVLLAGVACKLVWEQTAGPIPFSEATSGGAVLVDAHLYGAIGGVVARIVIDFPRRRR